MNTETAKIAFVTDDGTTISSHFGRALRYEVVTLENGIVTRKEERPKVGHHTAGMHSGHEHHGEHQHGPMTESIRDCTILVARGMGMGAHNHLTQMGIRPVLTDLQTIDDAIAAYVKGSLADNPKRLHDHGPGHNESTN